MRERWSIGSSDTPKARTAASKLTQIAVQAGHDVILHELCCPVQGAWAVKEQRCQRGVFFEEQNGSISSYCYDQNGVRCHSLYYKESSTKIEGTVEYFPVFERRWARWVASSAAFGLRTRRITVAVEGAFPERQVLKTALQAAGCNIESHWRKGIPSFWMERGGFSLLARDERGAFIDSGQLLAVVTLIEMEQGCGKVAFPPCYSQAATLVTAGYSGTVFQLERDGDDAQQLYAALPWLREAPSAAVRICTRMATARQSLETLLKKTPCFILWKREFQLPWMREHIGQQLMAQGHLEPEGNGFRLHKRQNWLHIRPLRGDRIQILAEGPDLELAEELCDLCVRQLCNKETQDMTKRDGVLFRYNML